MFGMPTVDPIAREYSIELRKKSSENVLKMEKQRIDALVQELWNVEEKLEYTFVFCIPHVRIRTHNTQGTSSSVDRKTKGRPAAGRTGRETKVSRNPPPPIGIRHSVHTHTHVVSLSQN